MPRSSKNYHRQFYTYLNSYAPVSPPSFDKIRPLLRVRRVEEKEYLLQIGEIAKTRYFICEGIIVSEYINAKGNVHIKNFFTEGNLAASTVSLLQTSPSAFALQSLTEGVVLAFNHEEYMRLVYENNDLKDFYLAYLEQSWVIKNEQRQIAFATQTATERYQTFLKEYPTLDTNVPQLYIASYLGITPTQLSRIRKNL
ncbi:Crp/Fnr family transcriptional regulator [Tunicatimonas pelagia]|uniref:Crp/Fnr family transcriptional regulator n=1 Tax=Tunicatimonas pelagia TaxID=931531 RepID=UPI0026657023|nr:Crp/Fnr family transcriptional regulator [Tunicatimonas pelagia]WKN40844.1 Crp/Fnr family transcriptional regulator [Tunicatimonas pelagia]